MITVLHGDDTTRSRDAIARIKSEFLTHEFYRFEGLKVNLSDVIQVFEAKSLFDSPKLIILENFIQTKNKELLASVFNHLKRDSSHEVILWEAKEIKKELLSFFPKQATIQQFKINSTIFQFLDAIRPGNIKQTLTLFFTVVETEEIEFVFFMLVRQFRLLLAITDAKSEKKIDELKRMAPWQKAKFEKQAQAFSKNRLQELYKQLFEIEIGLKSSGLTLLLKETLELFLISM